MKKTIEHVISAQQFLDRTFLKKLFASSAKMEKMVRSGKNSAILKNKILATVFYEPSTRTRFSFESAMFRLGGQVITTESAGQFSSAIKGESIEDSIRVMAGYADAIVLRHPQTGAAATAASVSTVPIINAGDGSGEHPTQALLDLYTMQKQLGTIDNLHIAMVGDLLYGRTIHSLLQFLPLYKKVKLSLVAPDKLKLPDQYLAYLKKHGVQYEILKDFEPILPSIDVFYMTRVQKERFATQNEYEQVKGIYIMDGVAVKKMKKKAIIMHPLPRVNEITAEVDSDPRAQYFEQAKNGLYVRMALLEMLLK